MKVYLIFSYKSFSSVERSFYSSRTSLGGLDSEIVRHAFGIVKLIPRAGTEREFN